MDNQKRFDFGNYQVVRQEFVDEANEINFTFSQGRAYINNYGLSLFKENYIQIYVDCERKNMVIKPLFEKRKDSFRWSGTGRKRRPRHMRCTPLYMMIFMMMNWDINRRYRITGYVEDNGRERVLFFDLKNAVAFKPEEEDKLNLKFDRSFPEEWRNSFGVNAGEHFDGGDIRFFEDQVEFDVNLKLSKNKTRLQEMRKGEDNAAGNDE